CQRDWFGGEEPGDAGATGLVGDAWGTVAESVGHAWDTTTGTVGTAWDDATEAVGEGWGATKGKGEGWGSSAEQVAGGADSWVEANYRTRAPPGPSKTHPAKHHIKGMGLTQEWLEEQGYRWVGTEQYKSDPPHYVEHWIHPETGDEVFRYVS